MGLASGFFWKKLRRLSTSRCVVEVVIAARSEHGHRAVRDSFCSVVVGLICFHLSAWVAGGLVWTERLPGAEWSAPEVVSQTIRAAARRARTRSEAEPDCRRRYCFTICSALPMERASSTLRDVVRKQAGDVADRWRRPVAAAPG